MESSQPPLATGTRGDFIRRVWALFEVLLVALTGPVVVQIGFIYLNVGQAGILSDTRILFLFMASEAFITLGFIVLFLRSRGRRSAQHRLDLAQSWLGNPTGHRLCTLAFRVHSLGERLL